MWRIFQRWGKVQDIFISRRLNQRGQRFGFVRYRGISNPQALEKQLDNIRIGNMKIHVNKPKYRRYVDASRKEGGQRSENDGFKNNISPTYKKVWKRKNTQTYAQIVKGEAMNYNNTSILAAMEIQVKEEEKEWLHHSYIGRVKNMSNIELIRESFILNGLDFIRLRYMGDDTMLLIAEGNTNIAKAIEENKEWLSTIFETISTWTRNTVMGHRRHGLDVGGFLYPCGGRSALRRSLERLAH